jgi:hypothetical protein
MAQKDKVTSYEAATMAEQISIDLIAPIAILEMLAEQDMTNKSSILYFVVERLEKQVERLDYMVMQLMETHRAMQRANSK